MWQSLVWTGSWHSAGYQEGGKHKTSGFASNMPHHNTDGLTTMIMALTAIISGLLVLLAEMKAII